MKCNICGYEEEEQFSVCPYCGEEVSLNNHEIQKQFGYDTNFENDVTKGEEINQKLNPAIFTPPPSVVVNSSTVVRNKNKLPIKEPKGFIRTANGFKITRYIDTGDFYHKYILFDILPLVIFFIMILHEGLFSFIFSKGFVCLLWFIASSIFNGFYSKFLNKFTFEVDPTGVYIHSFMKKYFIPKDNIKQFWFSRRTTSKDSTHGYLNFVGMFSAKMSAGYRGLTCVELPDTKIFDTSNYLTLCRIFFEVDEPIFQDEFLASEYKKFTRFIDAGLAFKDPANARFMEQEFERVLGIEDELVEGEFDYDTKVKAIKDKMLMKNRELENEV